MFFLATADEDGFPTCSYKGGDPGFVRVLDERTIAFPDLRRQRHVPLAREPDVEPARRPALHRLRGPEAAAARRPRERRRGRPAARRATSAHRRSCASRRSASFRTALATSTSSSSSSARASRRVRTASRRCPTGSGATGPATCSPPATRRTRVLARELELLGHAVVLGRARLEALERLAPGGARLGVVPLAAVERAEVRQHAAGAMAVADPRQERDRRLVGVERAGLVAGPRLGEAEPVQGQCRPVGVARAGGRSRAPARSARALRRSAPPSAAPPPVRSAASPRCGPARRGRALRGELTPQLLPA